MVRRGTKQSPARLGEPDFAEGGPEKHIAKFLSPYNGTFQSRSEAHMVIAATVVVRDSDDGADIDDGGGSDVAVRVVRPTEKMMVHTVKSSSTHMQRR
ncbi:2-oxo acid dehydrogenase subunit E2 [Sesbania bispinosa]|nr:2-oxo acid dehydrogenase subunit E2 [Sesbania bispinosa]